MKRRGLLSRLIHDRRGVAAIEFAIVAPLLIMMMFGMVMYGSWFWMAHSVQAMASEGARAAIAGLDPTEREQLARTFVGAQVSDLGLDAAKNGGHDADPAALVLKSSRGEHFNSPPAARPPSVG